MREDDDGEREDEDDGREDNTGGREDGDRGREYKMKAERIMTEGEMKRGRRMILK